MRHLLLVVFEVLHLFHFTPLTLEAAVKTPLTSSSPSTQKSRVKKDKELFREISFNPVFTSKKNNNDKNKTALHSSDVQTAVTF